MVVGIHQPNFFPWIGYFIKIKRSDVFIVLDEVQLSDRGYTNRTRLLNSNGSPTWMTASVNKEGHRENTIKDIKLKYTTDWKKKHLDFLLGAYRNGPYFDNTFDLVSSIYSKHQDSLIELNMDLITEILTQLEIETRIVYQSELHYDKAAKKSDLMLDLCRCTGANTYLSGTGAMAYNEEEDFSKHGIEVTYNRFETYKYKQINSNEFIQGLSILDAFFNVGVDSVKEYIYTI